jgi:ribosomal protein S18 acetylase RimI-like enzyme
VNDAISVREGTAADVDAASRLLAAAFADYPWTSHTVDPDDHGTRLTRLYRTVLAELVVPHGRLLVAETSPPEAGRPPVLVGAAGWLSPGTRPPEETLRRVARRVRELRGRRAPQAAAAEALVDAHATDRPHWYLGTIGVAPAGQGRGTGTRLLRTGLEEADRGRTPVRLETSSERNVAFYVRHGFRVVAELSVPDGPRCWVMERA